jgi:hypothetical protein
VQVPHVVAEGWGDVEEEGDLCRWAAGCGLEAEVAVAAVDVPVLEGMLAGFVGSGWFSVKAS